MNRSAALTLRTTLLAVLALFAIFLSHPAEAKAGKTKPLARQVLKPGKAVKAVKSVKTVKNIRLAVLRSRAARTRMVALPMLLAPPSMGEAIGLHGMHDPLDLKSSVALVMDQDTKQVLVSKNSTTVLPIASITKLMTAMVVVESGRPMDELLTIEDEDVDTEKNSRSRLRVGVQLTRGEMLHLALMSSENRAAHALGRSHKGGLEGFVVAMNAKARMLGMRGTRFVEPTGLSSLNQSSANDLAVLVNAAYGHQRIRDLSTSREAVVELGSRQVQFRNTNRLLSNPSWDIGLQKTGYIAEAGRCMVMQAQLAGRKLIMVFLDSAGKYSRQGDAERIRRWLGEHSYPSAAAPLSAPLVSVLQ